MTATSSTLAEVTAPTPPEPARSFAMFGSKYAMFIGAAALFVLVAVIRASTDTASLTSSQTIGTALRATVPILLAGLAGLWSERVGVVNIGIEGMMILGTWFGAYGAWQWGAWAGLAFSVVGGAIGGLIHAIATVRFNVDHVISGVAINIAAFGATRYLSEMAYVGEQGGGISQSPPQSSSIPRLNVPFLAGGWDTPDALGSLEDRGWFLLSDMAGVLRGLMYNVSWATVIALALVPLTWWALWRTRLGLRMRSSGEAPGAAETLGVRVVPLRYVGLAIGGGFAGLGGGFLSIVSSSYYRQGQTAERGYIGLATTIFGNWRPTGVLAGASLFGFGEALNLVGRAALPKLLLVIAIVAAVLAIRAVSQKHLAGAAVGAAIAALGLIAFLTLDTVPEPLTKSVPYLLTLIVLATAARRLRPPAWAGRPFRSGESH
jgi:ABC-type uncharacterized transport system permease subunit